MKGDQEIKCDRCGSIYLVLKHKTMMRDKDSLDCEVCGGTLIEWNGAVFFSNARLVQRGEWPKLAKTPNQEAT